MHQSTKDVVLGGRVDGRGKVDEDALDHVQGKTIRLADRNDSKDPADGIEQASVEHEECYPPELVSTGWRVSPWLDQAVAGDLPVLKGMTNAGDRNHYRSNDWKNLVGIVAVKVVRRMIRHGDMVL